MNSYNQTLLKGDELNPQLLPTSSTSVEEKREDLKDSFANDSRNLFFHYSPPFRKESQL